MLDLTARQWQKLINTVALWIREGKRELTAKQISRILYTKLVITHEQAKQIVAQANYLNRGINHRYEKQQGLLLNDDQTGSGQWQPTDKGQQR